MSDVEQHAPMKGESQNTECGSCGHSTGCSAGTRKASESASEFVERQALQRRLCRIAHKIMVLSGKGGVGKSTVAVNLARWLSMKGKRVGLLDVDIHGPSVPMMLGVEGVAIRGSDTGMLPVEAGALKVMSVGFLLRSQDEPVIWRGPMKGGVIKQLLKDVEWGELDYLVVDAPPGTGDEPLSVCQLVEDADGAVIVTTPQDVALNAVRKSINFCKQLRMPVIGVVENMSGYACPKCGEVTNLFGTGGGEKMAAEMGVRFLGRIPIDPALSLACDDGIPFMQRFADSPTSRALDIALSPVLSSSRQMEQGAQLQT